MICNGAGVRFESILVLVLVLVVLTYRHTYPTGATWSHALSRGGSLSSGVDRVFVGCCCSSVRLPDW